MIETYGWSPELQQHFHDHAAAGLSPARIIAQHRSHFRIATDAGELTAEVAGRLAFEAGDGAYPVAGDWVAVSLRTEEGTARIHAVLPRRTSFVRKAAGLDRRPQVIAANVDVAFLTVSLNADFNLRRLERYLSLTHDSGARAVVVLTKADLCDDPETYIREVHTIAPDVPVIAIAAPTGQGLDEVRNCLQPGETAVLLGSSGVGKSTLVNALSGREAMATKSIRESDARGRHTTTHRELVALPDGRLLLDTPGMREIALWDSGQGVSASFADVEALMITCRFTDCTHGTEPGCAVQAAIKDGTLSAERWENFGKLQREMSHLERKDNPMARVTHRKLWIGRNKANRAKQRQKQQLHED